MLFTTNTPRWLCCTNLLLPAESTYMQFRLSLKMKLAFTNYYLLISPRVSLLPTGKAVIWILSFPAHFSTSRSKRHKLGANGAGLPCVKISPYKVMLLGNK